MIWREGTEFVMHPKVGLLLSHGALGDTITSLPAIRFARASHNKAMKLVVWTRDDLAPLVSILVPGCDVRTLEDYHAEAQAQVDAGKPRAMPYPFSMNSSMNNTITRNKCDMVHFGFLTLLDCEPPNPTWMNYPTAPLGPRPADLDVKYVAIAPNGNAENRIIPASVLGPVIQGLLDRGLRPVILGRRESKVPVMIVTQNGTNRKEKKAEARSFFDDLPESLRKQCVDLRERTTTLEARDVLGHAECVIGIDGGLLHLAGTTDVPIVYGITSVDPAHRAIWRHNEANWKLVHVQPPASLKCRGCQSHWTLVFGFPFTSCLYSDNACANLDPQDFLNGLDALLKGDKQ